jgi:dephospho-CoA kinase
MPSIAITGGIATGKSVARVFLEQQLETIAFSADREISQLLDNDPSVAQELTTVFGPEIYHHGKKQANRVRLRAHLLANEASKKQIETILHHRLRSLWLPKAKQAQGKRKPFFLAEIPLLYENDLADYFDHVIVIAAYEKIILRRLILERGLSITTATALMKLQLPLVEKIKRAHQVVWNDGSIPIFYEQLQLALSSILKLSLV